MTTTHGSSAEVRHHQVLRNVCLLLVDGWELLLVVGLALHTIVGVVQGVVLHGVLRHHLVMVRRSHWGTLADLHLGAALLVAASAVLTSVPPVLDSIVGTATKASSNLSPTLAHLGNHLLNHGTLLWGDGFMVEVWLEVLVISLTALLWGAGLDHAGDAHPVVRALGVNKAEEVLVLSLGPGSSLVGRHSGDGGADEL